MGCLASRGPKPGDFGCAAAWRQHRDAQRLRRLRPPAKRTFDGRALLARVERVYDGDTIWVTTRLAPGEEWAQYSVRLAGIDAPELKPPKDTPNRDLHVRAGLRVRDWLRQRIPAGSLVFIVCQKEEKYGRLCAVPWTARRTWWGSWRRGQDLCAEILARGYAVRYGGKKKEDFDAAHLRRIAGGRGNDR